MDCDSECESERNRRFIGRINYDHRRDNDDHGRERDDMYRRLRDREDLARLSLDRMVSLGK